MPSLAQLKALDTLHLGIILTLSYNTSIDYFVTGDQGILAKKIEIEQGLKVKTVSPAELLELEQF